MLLIPVGGTFTIDALKATRVVEQLRPRLMVVPMHYKTDAVTIKELEPLALFLDGKPNVRRETSHTISLSPMKARPAAEILVLPIVADAPARSRRAAPTTARASDSGRSSPCRRRRGRSCRPR